jgi:hypothetical protein
MLLRPLDREPAHPITRTFLIRLPAGKTPRATTELAGRIEHLASGRHADFSNLKQLQGWIEQILDNVEDPTI